MPKQPSITIYLDEELKEKVRKEAKKMYLDISSFVRVTLGQKLNETAIENETARKSNL